MNQLIIWFNELNGILRMAIVLVLTFIIGLIVKFLFGIKFKNNRTRTILGMIGSVVFFIVWFAGIVLALMQIGVDTTSILVGAGITGIILGLGSESIIADVLAGIFLILDKDFQVGDIIALDDFRGEVTSVGIRTVSVKDAGGSVKVIRNSGIESVVNLSKEKSLAVVNIPFGYEQALEEAEEAVRKALVKVFQEHKEVFTSEPVYRGVDDMTLGNVFLLVTAEVAEGSIYEARRLILREVKLAFERDGIAPPVVE